MEPLGRSRRRMLARHGKRANKKSLSVPYLHSWAAFAQRQDQSPSGLKEIPASVSALPCPQRTTAPPRAAICWGPQGGALHPSKYVNHPRYKIECGSKTCGKVQRSAVTVSERVMLMITPLFTSSDPPRSIFVFMEPPPMWGLFSAVPLCHFATCHFTVFSVFRIYCLLCLFFKEPIAR